MTAEHARKIADAIEARDRAERNLDNAAKMPERDGSASVSDGMLVDAGNAYVEAQEALDALLRSEPVEVTTVAPPASKADLDAAAKAAA